jgi:hypothetical protein
MTSHQDLAQVEKLDIICTLGIFAKLEVIKNLKNNKQQQYEGTSSQVITKNRTAVGTRKVRSC